jgi:hypothetical protein
MYSIYNEKENIIAAKFIIENVHKIRATLSSFCFSLFLTFSDNFLKKIKVGL